LFQIDQRSSTPIYQQLVQEVKVAILRGVLRPGDRLPSVRELAGRLAINPNTSSAIVALPASIHTAAARMATPTTP
jgi:DNA-binding transcriptional regulator YhcF (GntR family)